ncbi:MAG: hypothetical protein KF764_17175 [Labilithrix sp.]|nr:hypothetical protein [Labilithrix sp.]MBX3225040.1 hypothetical protein [Labilithrix sp.]
MRKLVLAATLVAPLLAFAAGCKHPGSQKLEGRWKGQKAEGVPETAQVSANAFATNTEIIAQGNQIAIQTPAGRNPAATYTIDKEDATTLVIHTDRDGSAETFTFNEKADTMVWKIDDQRSITFKKVQ